MKVLLATDADWLVDEVVAALGDADTSFTVVLARVATWPRSSRPTAAGEPFDIGIFDLQIGSMGGMAVDDGAAPRRVERPAAARARC